MNADLKAKWIAALRSGRYTQTTGRMLDHEGGRCCLGVLCDVIGFEVKAYDCYDNRPDRNEEAYDICSTEVGFRTRITLSGMNDRGDSFEIIAHWIERNV